jgi:hypothetical protein
VVATAKRLGIPTIALITSWDNLSTKNRMVFRHDGYLVWSAHMRDELHALYPASRAVPTYVVGAPQFDALYDPRFQRSRAEYCATLGLDAERPIVLCALGAPGFLREVHGAAHLAERLLAGAFGDAQLVIRPHPLFDQEEVLARFAPLAPRVVVQRTAEPGDGLEPFQDEAQIVDWVNTFRHADVVVNLSSTATVDAAACDRPVVNLDYDPAPGGAHHALIRDINHAWPHFAPIAESGGVWLAASPEEVTEAVRTYLARPELHRERRRWIVERVCGFSDGRSGERLAAAILDFAGRAATPR